MNISDYLRSALVNHALKVATYAPPATIWAGLFTALPPSSAGGGTEVTASDYSRVSASSWSTATTGVSSVAAPLLFPSNGGTLNNWGTVLGVGLWDAPTGGHLLFYGPLSANIAMSINSSFLLSTGNLAISLS